MRLLLIGLALGLFSPWVMALSWVSHDCGQIQRIEARELRVIIDQQVYIIDPARAEQTLRRLIAYQGQRVCFDLEPGERGLVIQPESLVRAE
ncbi:hypothetical protein V6U78_00505 [Marinospirillum sp. MEB164]|uniref:Uncharacterized protein n=1 Tax=Marinospirillum alkalitolerans TaxID=3123374 RepID=A0ABW8PU34_9GAMM